MSHFGMYYLEDGIVYYNSYQIWIGKQIFSDSIEPKGNVYHVYNCSIIILIVKLVVF